MTSRAKAPAQSRPEERAPGDGPNEALVMLDFIARRLASRGIEISRYFARANPNSVSTQRGVKANIAETFSAARTMPQVVSVRKRKDNPGGDFVIMPVSTLYDLVSETVAPGKNAKFEPITERLRALCREAPPRAPKQSKGRSAALPAAKKPAPSL